MSVLTWRHECGHGPWSSRIQMRVQRLHPALRRCNEQHPGLLFSTGAVIFLRIWFAIWGAAMILVRGTPITPDPPTLYHGLTRVPDEGLSLLLAPWQRWDAIWYLRIANYGYASNDPSASFFPLFPLLVRVVALPLGGNYVAAALVVSTSCDAWGVCSHLSPEH